MLLKMHQLTGRTKYRDGLLWNLRWYAGVNQPERPGLQKTPAGLPWLDQWGVLRYASAEAGSLAAFLWQFEPDPRSRPRSFDWATLRALPQTPESVALSKALKKRGWSFVGPTTMYAFMQGVGIVNDHLDGCFCRGEIEKLRKGFVRPGS